MRARAKTATAMLGGAAALALTLGFGGVGTSPVASGLTATTHPPASVAPARPDVAVPAGHTGVHTAALTGCVVGDTC